MLNLLMGLKLWAHLWANTRIRLYCDNQAVVQVLSISNTRDAVLGACARNIWLLTAMYNDSMDFTHIAGVQNLVGDLLSRWKYDSARLDTLSKFIPNSVWMNSHIDLILLIMILDIFQNLRPQEASQRLWFLFRPTTLSAHNRMSKVFRGFLVVAGLSWLQASTPVILAFMEYLQMSGMSACNIANYLTAIRFIMIIHRLETACLQDQRIPLFIKALKIKGPL